MKQFSSKIDADNSAKDLEKAKKALRDLYDDIDGDLENFARGNF